MIGLLNLEKQISGCVELLLNLENYYEQRDTATKRRIVSSIFPEKLIFDKQKVRTLKVEPVVALICSNSKAFNNSKKEKHSDFGVLSRGVDLPGVEPGCRQRHHKLSTCLANA